MGNRRKSRELAMQALFYLDANPHASINDLDLFRDCFSPSGIDPFFRALVQGVHENRAAVDRMIERFSSHWKIHRMSGVDRNVLRVAVFELMFRDDIPPKVAINEAIDVGKKFGSDESGAFINGILDSVRLDLGKDAEEETGDRAEDDAPNTE